MRLIAVLFVVVDALHESEQARQETANAFANVQASDIVALEVTAIGEKNDCAGAVEKSEKEDAREKCHRTFFAANEGCLVPKESHHYAGTNSDDEQAVDDESIGHFSFRQTFGQRRLEARAAHAFHEKERDGSNLSELGDKTDHARNFPAFGQLVNQHGRLDPNAREDNPAARSHSNR